MYKKIFLFILSLTISSAVFCNTTYADNNTFVVKITPNDLKKINRPEGFATFVYGQVLANDEMRVSPYENDLAKLTFTKDLLEKFMAIRAKDDKLKGAVGCIDFGIFTAAQDILNTFWIEKAVNKANGVLLPVYLGLAGEKTDLKKPTVTLQLVKTPDGWKINDILYRDPEEPTLRSLLQNCLAHEKDIYQ